MSIGLEARVQELERENARLQSIIDAGWDLSTAGRGAMERINELERELSEVTSDLAAKVEEVAEAFEWRPIETAPKDGTRILASFDDEVVVVAGWNDSSWADDFGYDIRPTHWMPLPDPPRKEH